MHDGYLSATLPDEYNAWREGSNGWSDEAVVEVDDGRTIDLPLGARFPLREDGAILTPSGEGGHIVTGNVRLFAEARRDALRVAPARWALNTFGGVPYLWAGRSTWGVDCSGLVQLTFAARGVLLPRDADMQAECGDALPVSSNGAAYRPGDLLFYAQPGGRIEHVALWYGDDSIVHAALSAGGVVREDWRASAASALNPEGPVVVRRIRT